MKIFNKTIYKQDLQYKYKSNVEELSRNYYIYWVCVSSLNYLA
jgi:hypothetical protein